jgi:hypothetical protein
MNVTRSLAGVCVALAVIGLPVAACSPSGSPPVVSPPSATSAASADPSTQPTSAGTTIDPSTAPPSPGGPSAETPPAPAGPSIPIPPDASVSVEGGDPVVGTLGSFTWRNTGSDSPWLRGAPIHVGHGEELVVSLSGPVAIASWTAGRTEPASLDGSKAVGLAQGRLGPPRFTAPPPGTWSVQVVVWFAANQGSAAYYWLVEVD